MTLHVKYAKQNMRIIRGNSCKIYNGEINSHNMWDTLIEKLENISNNNFKRRHKLTGNMLKSLKKAIIIMMVSKMKIFQHYIESQLIEKLVWWDGSTVYHCYIKLSEVVWYICKMHFLKLWTKGFVEYKILRLTIICDHLKLQSFSRSNRKNGYL